MQLQCKCIEDLYKRFKCLKIFNEFFVCIYLDEGRAGGGGALMHAYVLKHIVSFSHRTA